MLYIHLSCSDTHLDLHSFPTRRSSDLLSRSRLRLTLRREGRYLLRTNLTSTDPAQLWQFYLQLVEVEAAFRDIKRSEEHTSELQSPYDLVCRLLLEKKKEYYKEQHDHS